MSVSKSISHRHRVVLCATLLGGGGVGLPKSSRDAFGSPARARCPHSADGARYVIDPDVGVPYPGFSPCRKRRHRPYLWGPG